MIPKYIIRKIIFYFFSFWFVLFLDFLIPHLMPGNPVDAVIGSLSQTTTLTPQQIASLKSSLGYTSGPIPVEFLKFVENVFRGKFGVSIQYYPTPVLNVIDQSIGWTILLFGAALIISFYLGNYLGLRSAFRRGSKEDSVLSAVSLFLYSFPYFWLALLFLFFFAIQFHIFPEAGAYNNIYPLYTPEFFASSITHIILPLLTLVIASYGSWYLGMRNNAIVTINEDYLKYAEIAGLPRSKIMKYSKMNAILPNLTAFALAFGNIIGGGILVEMVFSYPGLGFDIYNAVINEDFPTLETAFLLIIIAVLIANFIMDILYYRLDPRIRDDRT
ncbi:ABC transporter permease [Thermoplasma sp.]|uniref:ABC transporter permease n=1 Tax=Thermoplasma sp. TaxID=1973142 RepID=UPI002626436E|nr:ABC transporter permease [Thermoplasma sp.]